MTMIAQGKKLIKKDQKVDVYKLYVKVDHRGNLTLGENDSTWE